VKALATSVALELERLGLLSTSADIAFVADLPVNRGERWTEVYPA